MSKHPLALWVFGPIASGKSWVLSHLPLDDFERIDQDAAMECELSARGWHMKVNQYDATRKIEFDRVRAETASYLWQQVPGWRLAGKNLAFETTGDKPHLFRAEIEAGRNHGYETLVCGLRCPLAHCLAQNEQRARTLPEAVVEATWLAFERALSNGVYREMFAQEQFHVCDAPQEAVDIATAWLHACA